MVSVKDLRKKEQGDRGLTILHQAGRCRAEQYRAEQSREEHCLIKPCQVKPLLGGYCLIGFLLARIIHEGSLRKRADAERDRHSETGDWLCRLTSASSVEPLQCLSHSADQAPRRMAPAPNSMSKG
jgi:hypothetical protein